MHKGLFTWRWGTPDSLGNMWRITPPPYHVNVIKLKWEISGIWTGGLPHLFKAGYLADQGSPRPSCKQVLYKSDQAKLELICCCFVHNNQPASRRLHGGNVWNWIRWIRIYHLWPESTWERSSLAVRSYFFIIMILLL